MSEFDTAVTLILQLEGGLSDHPSDPGGVTKYGISSRSYPHVDVRNLTISQAKGIYHRDYWTPVAMEVTDPALRLLAFDSAVNHGLSRALAWLAAHRTFETYLANRIRFYTGLETWPTFGRGWMRRVAKVVEAARSPANPVGRADVLVDNRGGFSRLSHAVRGRSGPVAYRVRPLAGGEGVKLDIDSA